VLQKLPPRRVLQAINLYPPYLGAGVRVVDVEGQGARVDAITVELKLATWNRNFFGTQFGGSLYSMADPWFVLLLNWKLGPPYAAWDKAASIEFLSPGRGAVRARFHVSDAQADEIRAAIERDGKAEPVFTVELRDRDEHVVARVTKRLSAFVPRRR